jgi:hypothetical protein
LLQTATRQAAPSGGALQMHRDQTLPYHGAHFGVPVRDQPIPCAFIKTLMQKSVSGFAIAVLRLVPNHGLVHQFGRRKRRATVLAAKSLDGDLFQLVVRQIKHMFKNASLRSRHESSIRVSVFIAC